MPNWCQNSLIISGPEESIQKIYDTKLDFQSIIPRPAELDDSSNGNIYDKTPERLAAIEMIAESNYKKYGAVDWYYWNVDNWGTKWEVQADIDIILDGNNSQLTATFDSAWSPPIPIIHALYSKFSIESIKFDWIEPGCASAGTIIYRNGKCDEHEINYMNDLSLLKEFAARHSNFLAEAYCDAVDELT